MPHVLIVDDSPTNLIFLRRRVEALDDNIRLTTFNDAKSALEWLDQHCVELIIADYEMPGMNGVTFTRNCRTLLHCQNTPIVMVTAARRRKVCLAALKAGATEFLNSPVGDEEFRKRIAPLLRQKSGQNPALPDAIRPQDLKAPDTARDLSQLNKKLFSQILDSTPVMLSVFDRMGQCIYFNASQAALLDNALDGLTGVSHDNALDSLRTAVHDTRDQELLNGTAPTLHIEHQQRDQNGIVHHLVTTKTPLLEQDGTVSAVVNTTIDETGRKRAEDNLLHVAEHDCLTELPNRTCLRNHVARCLEGSLDAQATGLALLFIDIDRFKGINDAFGHQAGDRLLIEIASRIDAALRSSDFVARIGGDEFAVVLNGVTSLEVARRRAREICRVVELPLTSLEQDVRVSASIGIACYPESATTIDELLVKADLAMYRAKSRGGNDCHAHTLGDARRARQRASLESDLNCALSRGEFLLHYQPILRLSDHKVLGAEALVRWQHPVRGLVPPGDFLPIAEECNLILELGDWIINQACRDASRWQKLLGPDVTVSINLAPPQFQRQDIPALVRQALDDHKLDARGLKLELTEQTMFANEPAFKSCLDDLRALGCGLSLDDFGTGYGCLMSLRSFPITEIKIDRSFVAQLSEGESDIAIVEALCGLGRSLSIDVVAEGVETPEQAHALRDIGCGFGQGYLFARPAPFQDFIDNVQTLQGLAPELVEQRA